MTHRAQIVAAAVGLMVVLAAPAQGDLQKVTRQYEGLWQIQPNGDVKVSRTFTLPMIMYRAWKKSDMHMLELRSMDARRSLVEASDAQAAWDDAQRKLKLMMTVHGLAKNLGDHWEAKMMPGLSFSNLDQAKRSAYFHFSTQSPMGKIDGRDVVVMPDGATDMGWEAPSRSLHYVCPAPEGSAAQAGRSGALWWTLMAVCLAIGAALWVAPIVIAKGKE